jgi:hypothetical protein
MTFPHRPAAFPSQLPHSQRLPSSGWLTRFTSFPSPPSTRDLQTTAIGKAALPAQACVPAAWPPIRWSPPAKIPGPKHGEHGVKIALIERGGCDFATKVLAAQERGAGAVIVGDTAAAGETREEGAKRAGGLITMFSPGTLFLLLPGDNSGVSEATGETDISQKIRTVSIYLQSSFLAPRTSIYWT